MATTAELSTIIATRLRVKIIGEFLWSDVISAVGALSAADKTQIVLAARTNDAEAIGRVVLKGVQTYAATNADTEATTMMADNAMDFVEIDRVLS